MGGGREVLFLCALKRLLGARFRLVAVDVILGHPAGPAGWLRLALMRWLLRAIDLFILYCKDTAALRHLYRIPEQRVAYIPFKVNSYERVLTTPTRDDEFILACGRSKRDYATFCEAVAPLALRATILAHIGRETREHGSHVTLSAIPANVTVVADDGSPESWLAWIARSTAVVIPVLPDTLAPSGISTYLVAMALGKCVIITDSPATRGILTDREAVIVPPSDAEALRAAIARVAEDAEFRLAVAERGQAYALSLGGVERVAEDVVGCVEKLFD
jgi:glycosyltransferase involved in cell wall biosynthesis